MKTILIRSLLLAFVMLAVSVPAFSQIAVGVSVSFGPPAIPVYDQPICPGDGYIWTPGYWAWDADFDDYYWVPGTWVEPPEVGFLWTPGYWAWNDGAFVFYDGYWGPVVGFYGGINYGFGYFGDGFAGGRWDRDHFYYNRTVTNVNVTVIHNVYEERVTNVTVNRVSYNGGNGGVMARPTPQQQQFANQRHVAPVAAQAQQVQAARGNQDLRASANHGKPPIAATDRPGAFNDHVVKAKDAGAPYHPPANRSAATSRGDNNTRAENNPNGGGRMGGNRPSNENVERSNSQPNNMNPGRAGDNASSNRVIHPKDMPTYERPPAPNTGNAKLDQKYQQQQQKLADQQSRDQQKLQQQQEREHQQYQKQQADEARNQAMEQRHQQQTQQLQQHQQQQQQELQRRQAPPPSHASPPEHSKEPKDHQ